MFAALYACAYVCVDMCICIGSLASLYDIKATFSWSLMDLLENKKDESR